ncbi:MAG: cation-translocating P-type ATPase [Streptococcaceae bacterium]|nr:cation-translocating P-type ATPase [Streptococcaceae bacterium]
MENFYSQSIKEVLEEVKSSENGLSQQEAAKRLATYGRNELTAAKKKSIFAKFLGQFKDLMIIILLVAAVLSVVTSGGEDIADALIILAVVLINAAFGVWQEGRAEAAIEALKKMSSPAARVRRGGHVIEIDSKDLVVGDIVLLEAGDVVPADLRLIESASLKIEEAALTGESVPVEKDAQAQVAADAGIGDRINSAFQNSNVTYGRATGVVTATAMATEVGKIAKMIENADETETPLKRNLNRLSRFLTWMILGIALVTFIVHVLRLDQITPNGLVEGLMTSVALAVAAIPEGLPAIVTIVLSLSTQVLAKQNSIIRKLPAVETLGSTDIICSDKTGTLTMNQMTVEKIYTNMRLQDASEELPPSDLTLQIMNFANDTKVAESGDLIGDPTETALVKFGQDKGFDITQALIEHPRVAELPFDSDRKLMSTAHDFQGKFFVAVKGAPDQLLKHATKKLVDGEVTELTSSDRESILSINRSLAKAALRVLMMAYKEVTEIPAELNQLEENLIFSGLVGMIDPERPEAAEAVKTAKAAGIRPIMITGDHQDTAEAIAKRLGIIEEDEENHVNHVLTGAELNELSDKDFQKQVQQYSVYARVSPEHKVRIVKAWQNEEKVVAMTGDGVNDAPALKTADIGIGMGITGTEVSKGASDMILADDNFATIISAVREGRKVFANIQRSIQYLLSANTAEVLTVFLATLFGWATLLPVHLLWINLVTDTLPAIALGVEPIEPGIMDEKPRGKKASFFSGGVLSSIIYQGLLQAALVISVYGLALLFPAHTIANTSIAEARELLRHIGEGAHAALNNHAALISALEHADALTMAFATLGLIQLFHAFNVKSVHQSIFTVGLWKNRTFNWALPVSFLLLAVTILVPGFNKLFHVSQLDPYQWGIVLVASISIIIIVEIVKAIQRKFINKKS